MGELGLGSRERDMLKSRFQLAPRHSVVVGVALLFSNAVMTACGGGQKSTQPPLGEAGADGAGGNEAGGGGSIAAGGSDSMHAAGQAASGTSSVAEGGSGGSETADRLTVVATQPSDASLEAQPDRQMIPSW